MRFLADGSLQSLLAWWLVVTAGGLLTWQFCRRFLPLCSDQGYAASKILGLLIATYVAWLASAWGGVSFSRHGVAIGGAALVLVNVFSKPTSQSFDFRKALLAELLFVALLAVGLLIRISEPDIYGLEKFMDIGFMNAGMMATSMPPPDPWYGGQPINYYYFGHLMAAWLTKASGVPPDHGYNLMMATIFALYANLILVIVHDCLRPLGRHIAKVMAAITTACVMVGGNFHTLAYSVFRPWMHSTTGREDFYYPDSTRFIGFDPETTDKAITEMPAYGFAVGDMHAHILNLPVNMLIVIVLLHIVKRVQAGEALAEAVSITHVLMLGFALGIGVMTNSWDVGIYGILIAITGLTVWAMPGQRRAASLLALSLRGTGIVMVAGVVALPFLLNFVPFGQGFRWTNFHTPLWQWALLHAHVWPACGLALWMLLRKPKGEVPTLFAGSLTITAFFILMLPELFYVKDIYGDDYARANTMFKLAFQAQPMAVMAAGIAIGNALQQWRSGYRQIIPFLLVVPMMSTLIYPKYWLWDRLIHKPLDSYSLSGLDFMSREAPDDQPLVEVVRGLPLAPRQVILEADGDSYTLSGRFSALTGQPTALGWRNHEWLWRADNDQVAARSKLVKDVYEARDPDIFCAAIIDLNVRYIIVGTVEMKSFADWQNGHIEKQAVLRAESGKSRIYELKSGACGTR